MTFVMARGDNAPTPAVADTLKVDSLKLDTTKLDSLQLAIQAYNKAVDDSIAADSINRAKSNGLDAPVNYVAKDSMVYYANTKRAFLYGKSNVKYENMDLSAANIDMSLDSSVVHATGAMDTVKKQRYGLPVFLMGEDKYETDTMAFNFKTKRGLIQNAYTHQDDGFLLSERSKRDSEGNFYLKRGRYTTCDDPEPDFYIALTRAKVRPGKDVVFGPAYLVVQDVPLPLAIPYGFFPFTKSYSSGVIMPTYGDEMDRGFYLRDGGYYFAISDKMDLKLLGEVFTKGSWGVSAASNYNVRYKYNGQFFASYQDSRYGDEGIDQRKETSFKIQWTHRQDAKANPYTSLTASVNFSSTSYETNNLTSMYNPTLRTQSTRTSSVSWSTTMSSIGLTLSSQASLAQNMRDSTLDMTLPDLNIYLTQFYPFKRKHAAGKQRWYEKINVAYTGQISNTIHTKENQLFHSSFTRDWRNGWMHTIPVKASFTVAKYLSVTPSFTFVDRMYTQKIARSWDVDNQREVLDTIQGFYNVYNWNASVNLNTKIYGFFIPNRKIFGDKIMAIRHVFTPQVSFSYAPDFSASRYGYYDTYIKTDSKGVETPVQYSYYANNLFNGPGQGKTGRVSLTLDNNIEMKIRSNKDSTGIRKISVIDRLAATMSYNMAAKERPWSDLVVDLRLKWWKNYTFSMNAVFATYAYELDNNGKPYVGTHTEWSRGRFGRFQGLSQTFNYTINPEKLRKLFGGKKRRKDGGRDSDDSKSTDTGVESNVDPNMMAAQKKAEESGGKMAETDDDGYLKFSMPWSLTISYGINMRENTSGTFNKETMRYPYKFTHNLNFYGYISLSSGWNITVNSGYDFEYRKLSLTTASLARDLHCFSMACSVVLAPYTSYNFSFKCNASTLTDALKYDKRSSYSNNVKWY
jgi:hypothetical protein